jgi:hypothetical protein
VILRRAIDFWRLPINSLANGRDTPGIIMCDEEIDDDDEIESLREYLEGKIEEKFEELEKKLLLRFRGASYCRICQNGGADGARFDPALSAAEILFHRAAHTENRPEAESICNWNDVERLAVLKR